MMLSLAARVVAGANRLLRNRNICVDKFHAPSPRRRASSSIPSSRPAPRLAKNRLPRLRRRPRRPRKPIRPRRPSRPPAPP